MFTRACDVHGNVAGLSKSAREAAFCFEAAVPADTNHEIPDFYETDRGFLAEIAWRVDGRGAPVATSGIRRYPIAYTGHGLRARTGLGVHYSGPFTSDQERLESSTAAFNGYLTDLCDAAVVKLLRDHLVVRHGAIVLSLLVDPSGSPPARILQLTENLLAQRAIPLDGRLRGKWRFGPRRASDGSIRPVVVPAYTWAREKIAAALLAVCPKELDQIDPDMPQEIVGLLADNSVPDGSLSGWKLLHTHP